MSQFEVVKAGVGAWEVRCDGEVVSSHLTRTEAREVALQAAAADAKTAGRPAAAVSESDGTTAEPSSPKTPAKAPAEAAAPAPKAPKAAKASRTTKATDKNPTRTSRNAKSKTRAKELDPMTRIEFTMPGKVWNVLTGAETLKDFRPRTTKPTLALLERADLTPKSKGFVATLNITVVQADKLLDLLIASVEQLNEVKSRTHHENNTARYMTTTIDRINEALDAAYAEAA